MPALTPYVDDRNALPPPASRYVHSATSPDGALLIAVLLKPNVFLEGLEAGTTVE